MATEAVTRKLAYLNKCLRDGALKNSDDQVSRDNLDEKERQSG